jgi:PKHD-type hydroxylase
MFFVKGSKYTSFIGATDVFNKSECDALIGYKASKGQVKGKVVNEGTYGSVRASQITWLKDEDPDVSWVFKKITNLVNDANNQFFHMDIQYIEDLQLGEYNASYDGFYGQHVDAVYTDVTADVRKLSLTIQLSNPRLYKGGSLKIYPSSFIDPHTANTAQGSATLFRSHIIHEVTPVTKGTRFSLVAWVRGPVPK